MQVIHPITHPGVRPPHGQQLELHRAAEPRHLHAGGLSLPTPSQPIGSAQRADESGERETLARFGLGVCLGFGCLGLGSGLELLILFRAGVFED